MASGGYRANAGRKKGQKDRKPRKLTEEQQETEQIKQLLSLGVKAKAKFYQEFLIRVANKDGKQKPLSIVEKRMMNALDEDLKANITDGNSQVEFSDYEATEFLRVVWNDPKIDMALRIRAAEIIVRGAAEKPGGKKDDKKDRAEEAGRGKFAPSKPPLALVK
jgi:hypothetical protein